MYYWLATFYISILYLGQVANKQLDAPLEKLSDYKFFVGKLADLQPVADVLPYELPTPLFSDYAHKARFIKIPAGAAAQYKTEEVFDFPIGTILIKNFYYPYDFRKPNKGRRILETRLLLHQTTGWESLVYIWNNEQTEAYLDLAGDTKPIEWIDEKGKKQKLNYQIPNVNQCKGCHSFKDKLMPIGPTARQLNSDFNYTEGSGNQLIKWQEKGILTNLPNDQTQIPKIATWHDSKNWTLEQRARAYLDINCGHCHRPEGSASTSGLFLHFHETNSTQLGILKTPVAAGRGSGGLQYNIVPKHPEKSILVFRMESTDAGVMMPEIARQLVDKEGLTLIKDWIKNMK